MEKIAMRRPNILLLFGQGAEAYRREKARGMFLSGNNGVEPSAEQLTSISQPVSGLSIATPAQFPSVTDEQMAEVNLRSRCLLEHVERMSPLLEGERIEEDFFSYLTEPFESLPASTVLLRRRTNLGELYYLVENVGITPHGELVPQGSALPAPRVVMFDITLGSAAAWLGEKVASGLVSAIGGAIFSAIWDQMFPPGVPDYFDQVYEEISRRLRADVAVHIKGALGNIQNAISSEYRPRRAGADLSLPRIRQDLFNMLQKYDNTFLSGSDGMMGTLMDPTYAEEAFPVFLLGGGLQLALYQEMANVDPVLNSQDQWPSPLESSYGRPQTGTTAITAKRLAAHARQTWTKMMQKREEAIKLNELSYAGGSGGSGVAVALHTIEYSDGGRTIEYVRLEYKDENKNNQLKAAVCSRFEAYKAQKKAAFVEEYNHPESVCGEWEKLIDRPILLDKTVSPPTHPRMESAA